MIARDMGRFFGKNVGKRKAGKELHKVVEVASLLGTEEQNMEQRILTLERKSQKEKLREFVQRVEEVRDSDEGKKPFWMAVKKFWKENPMDM